VLHDLSLLSLLSARENVEFAASNGKVAPHFQYDGMTYYFASPLCAGSSPLRRTASRPPLTGGIAGLGVESLHSADPTWRNAVYTRMYLAKQ
jgi:hypothetical protein